MPMLEGEISEIQLVERLVELWREQFTGAIRFENDGIIKIVYFKGGDILSASTNDRTDSIDEILMRAGKVSREHVKQALAKRKESETLGDALLNLGFITRKELTWARRVQVVGVIRSIAAWTTGSFTIVADYLPKRDEGTLFPLPQILVELIVTDPDRQHFERALDGGRAVFEKARDFDDVFHRLGLNEDADAIVAHVDGARSAAEVAAASGRDTFNVYKLLHALNTLRILTRSANARGDVPVSLDDFATAGIADAADMWDEPAATPVVPPMTPQFELDDAPSGPTVEMPVGGPSAWDDDAEETYARPQEPAQMPAWDSRPLAAAPVPVPIEPPADATEEQWGFDDAQIEASQRITATTPAVREPLSQPLKRGKRESGSRMGLIIALMVVFILAAAGYFGFRWWQGKQAAEIAANNVVVRRPVTRPIVPPVTATAPPATQTIADLTTTTIALVTTTTAAPPAPTPKPITPTPKPIAAAPKPVTPKPITVPPPSDTAALPAVVARTTSASPSAAGNYTIQIAILCEATNLDKTVRSGGGNVWSSPITIKGRSCHRVFWGHFDTQAAAQSGMASVPSSLRDKSAAVVRAPKG